VDLRNLILRCLSEPDQVTSQWCAKGLALIVWHFFHAAYVCAIAPGRSSVLIVK